MTGTGGSREKFYFFADGGFNAVRDCETGLFFDVTPDFDEVERSLRRKNEARTHLSLAFKFRQMSVQLVFRDSFAAVELLDAAPDLRVDCIPVFQEPTILFFLGLQQTEQYFLGAAGAGCLKLLLESGLKGRIVDFDVHGLVLQDGIGFSFHRSRGDENVKKMARFLGRGPRFPPVWRVWVIILFSVAGRNQDGALLQDLRARTSERAILRQGSQVPRVQALQGQAEERAPGH